MPTDDIVVPMRLMPDGSLLSEPLPVTGTFEWPPSILVVDQTVCCIWRPSTDASAFPCFFGKGLRVTHPAPYASAEPEQAVAPHGFE